MRYPVQTIASAGQISTCALFEVNHFQWNCTERPRTAGRMGYIPGSGLFIQMECYETEPKRTHTRPQSQVCKDSAMEAFFTFSTHENPPSNDSMYLNFEINANGAMYAKYGAGRKNRSALSHALYRLCNPQACILPDRWQISFLLPLSLLEELYGITAFNTDDYFYCNFYKISEDPEIEHYASLFPIESDTPNFHLPRCFGQAVVV